MISGKKVRLRAVERSDLPKICQWLNDEEVMYYWGEPGNTTSLAEVERWFNQELERSRQDRKTYIIETLDGVAIGQISYEHLSMKNRNAELGIQIGEKEYWDKGYGTDAIMAFLDYLFNELNLFECGWERRATIPGHTAAMRSAASLRKESSERPSLSMANTMTVL